MNHQSPASRGGFWYNGDTMLDLLAIGDLKLDVFVDLGRKARVACDIDKHTCRISMEYGKKIPVEHGFAMIAGSAPNIAIGVRRLGRRTGVLSVVGDDTTATLAKDVLEHEHVDHAHLHVDARSKSSFSAILTFEGESTVLAVHHPHTYRLHPRLAAAWMIVGEMGPTYTSLFRSLATRKKRDGFRLAINPGTLQLEALDQSLFRLIAIADLLLVNRSEAVILTKEPAENTARLMRSLQRLGPKTVVMTDGQNGAFATEDGTISHAPAFPAKRVETTGAGDAFASGMLAAILTHLPLATALAWGTVNSASVIEHVGGQQGLLSRREIENRLKQHPRYHVRTL